MTANTSSKILRSSRMAGLWSVWGRRFDDFFRLSLVKFQGTGVRDQGLGTREKDDPGRGEAVSGFRRRDARYGGRRGFQLPQTSIHRILEINPRGEAAIKPPPLKPVCSTLQPTPQYPIGEKSPSDKLAFR